MKGLQSSLSVIAYASGIAAGDVGCQDGPEHIRSSPYLSVLDEQGIVLSWDLFCSPSPSMPLSRAHTLDKVRDMCEEIAHAVEHALTNKQQFLVIGGDHSCAIGTWSGAKYFIDLKGEECVPEELQDVARRRRGETERVYSSYMIEGESTAQQRHILKGEGGKRLGLIWVDAHLDAHTFTSSLSGNIHGMPVAALLGAGDKKLTHMLLRDPKILPQDIFFIGARSYEESEYEFIKHKNIRIYHMDEVNKRSLKEIFREILAHMNQYVDAFGVSIDLDAFDPSDAPGTGTPASLGIHKAEFLSVIDGIGSLSKFLGAEITEYNPHRDVAEKTQRLLIDLIGRIFHTEATVCPPY